MNAIGLYDTMIMGYRVKIQPYKITIFDEDDSIEGTKIPNKIVKYIIHEGFCETWLTESMNIKVNIYRVKDV
tara:strand:+ start:715 stop:930 length:216 start_codon:yes stop_codon:yes gene_type:complete